MKMVKIMDKVKLMIPKKSEYLSTVRLTTSALSNIKEFNIDAIEDIKVIVSEICVFFINNIINADNPLEIEYFIEDDIFKVGVTDLNCGEITEKDKNESNMCILIIESLADKHEIDLKNNKIFFEKNII